MERDCFGITNYKGFYLINKVTDTMGTYFNHKTNEIFSAPLNEPELKDLEYSYAMNFEYKMRTYQFQEKITNVIITNGQMKDQIKTFAYSYVGETDTGFKQLYARFTDGTSCPFRYVKAYAHKDYGDITTTTLEEVKGR